MIKWPLALRSTVDRLKLELWSSKQSMAETQMELAKHRMLLSGRVGTMKVMKSIVSVVK